MAFDVRQESAEARALIVKAAGDEKLLAAVERTLERDFVTTVVGSVADAADAIRTISPQLLVLLHGSGPLSRLVLRLTEEADGAPVIVISAIDLADLAVEAIHAGAADFVVHDRIADLPVRAARALADDRLSRPDLGHLHKMELLGQLASGIAHDFNNLLSAIVGQVALLRSRPPADISDALDHIDRACSRATSIVGRLLAFSRKENLEKATQFALQGVIEEVAEICRATFDRRLHIEIELPRVPLQIFGNPTLIHQVLLNLCVNARDALLEKVSEGSAAAHLYLRISVDTADIDEAFVTLHPEARPGHYAVIRLHDNGVGMAPETLERIFEPFFTTKPKGRGTGLGLSMVRNVTRSHGGWVDVQSVRGAGTAFSLYLPLSTGRPVEHQAPFRDDPDDLPHGTERVLVVDDDPFLGGVVEQLLEEFGYDVVLARDGQEGLDVFKQSPRAFALVLSDLSMPGLSGIELVREIRKLDKAVRIICASGYFPDAESLELEGVDEILSKPFRAAELARCIRRTLDKR